MAFKEAAIRLMREVWSASKVQSLAEELYAIIASWDEAGLQGPVTINNPTDQPGLTVRNFGDTSTGLQIEKHDPGEIITREITTLPADDVPPAAGSSTSSVFGSGGNVVPGLVVDGSGATYTVAIYEAGRSHEPTRQVTVTQMQIDEEETIPAGTAVYVVGEADGSFSMQVPVWLE